MRSVRSRIVGAALCAALCIAPTMASAATAPASVQAINPMVAVSLLGSPASAAALCGAQAANAAPVTGRGTQVAPGCVLPYLDPVQPSIEAAAVTPPARSEFAFLLAPLLASLAIGSAGIGAAALTNNGDNEPQPVSPG